MVWVCMEMEIGPGITDNVVAIQYRYCALKPEGFFLGREGFCLLVEGCDRAFLERSMVAVLRSMRRGDTMQSL